eukprot:12785563-Ditylum_brightwellii.AAC.1
MAEDELCGILYQMVKHDWHNSLCKSGGTPMDMGLKGLVDYFERIKFLKEVKQNSEIIAVNNNNDKGSK